MYFRHNNRGIIYTGGKTYTTSIDDPDVAGGRRCEDSSFYRMPINESVRWNWQTNIPGNWPQDSNWCVISQCHDSGDQLSPFAIEIFEGDLIVRVRGQGYDKSQYRKPINFDSWLEFELKARWSETENGMIELDMNGKRIVEYHGTTYYNCREEGPYFKCGIYMSKSSEVKLRAIQHRI